MNISDLLKFDFDSKAFEAQANIIITKFHEQKRDQAIAENQQIADKYDYEEDKILLVENLEKQIEAKVLSLYNGQTNTPLTIKETRYLCYSLNAHDNTHYLAYIFNLIRDQWKNSFINGLLYSLLSEWETSSLTLKQHIIKILSDKLKSYTGTRDKYLAIKNNMTFLDPNGGALRLGRQLRMSNQDIMQALTYFGLKVNHIGLSYFSSVIVEYYNRAWDNNFYNHQLDQLNELLCKHKNADTSKRVLSTILIDIDANARKQYQSKIKTICYALIGNPSIDAKWELSSHFPDVECERIKKAQKILKYWETQQYISIFFDKSDLDSRRKSFWLKHTKEIHSFFIVGSDMVLFSLKADSRIRESLSHHFRKTNSKTSPTSALVMVFDQYILIEFSDVGAVYAYKKTTQRMKLLNRSSFDSIRDLKDTSLSSLVESDRYYHYFNNEGSMRHQGDWEGRLSKWIQNKMNIYV